MKTYKVREYPAPAYNAATARKMGLSCRSMTVTAPDRLAAMHIARQAGWGAGRALTAQYVGRG